MPACLHRRGTVSVAPEVAQPASLLDLRQPLGVLPTLWYWRRVEGTRAGAIVLGGVGLAAGFGGGVLAGAAPGLLLAGVAMAAVFTLLLLGLCERGVRRALRARRFVPARPGSRRIAG